MTHPTPTGEESLALTIPLFCPQDALPLTTFIPVTNQSVGSYQINRKTRSLVQTSTTIRRNLSQRRNRSSVLRDRNRRVKTTTICSSNTKGRRSDRTNARSSPYF